MSLPQFDQAEAVRLADVKPGDQLVADAGFPCIPAGAVLEVHADDHGPYVHCCGPDDDNDPQTHHYLDGQSDDEAEPMVGLRRVKAVLQ